jgi:hypothetical protein
MVNDEALLFRYLNATRRDCQRVSGPEIEAAKFAAARAFPGIDFGCDFVTIRSKGRRCEFRKTGNSSFVILDLELSDRLMELDLLVQVGAMKPGWAYTFFVTLLGDSFRQHRDLRRYRYCVLKVRGDVESLRGLASLPKDGPPLHVAIAPVLLHELAHIVFRSGAAFVDELRLYCSTTLEKFARVSEKVAETGQLPIKPGVTLGTPIGEYDLVRMKRQLGSYVSAIRGNEELEEELTCDLIAALAFVNFEGAINCFEEITPSKLSLSKRQLGDVFYLAIKTSRYLQILAGIAQFGSNVVARSDDLDRGVIEMTARTNALTDLLINVFQAQLAAGEFPDKPGFEKPLTNEQIATRMHHSLGHLMRQHHDHLLGPFEKLTGFFVSDEEFAEDEARLAAAFRGVFPDSFEAVDVLRSELPL